MIIEINHVSFTRAGLADILAEAERRQMEGHPKAPPVAGEGETCRDYGVRLSAYVIQLACEQAAVTWFDMTMPGACAADARVRLAAKEAARDAEAAA